MMRYDCFLSSGFDTTRLLTLYFCSAQPMSSITVLQLYCPLYPMMHISVMAGVSWADGKPFVLVVTETRQQMTTLQRPCVHSKEVA